MRRTQARGATVRPRGPRQHRARATRGSPGADPDLADPDPPPHRCESCGASLAGRRPQTRFCGDTCRKRFSRLPRPEPESPLERLADAAIDLVELGALNPWDALLETIAPGPELSRMLELAA